MESEVSDDLKALKERVAKLVDLYEAAINKVKEANDQAVHDFLARRLYIRITDVSPETETNTMCIFMRIHWDHFRFWDLIRIRS